MKMPLSKEEFFDAVKSGVKDAILTMTESGDGFTDPIRTEEFLEAIKNGVENSLDSVLPTRSEMNDIIYAAFRNKE